MHTEYQDMMLEAFKYGSAEIYVFGEKLLPMDVVGTTQVMNYKLDVPNNFFEISGDVDKYRKIWSEYIDKNANAMERYSYYPLSCRYNNVLAVFDPVNSEILDYVPVNTIRAVSNIKLGFTKEELEQYKKIKQSMGLENNSN